MHVIDVDFQRLFEVSKSSVEKQEMVQKTSKNVSVMLEILIYLTQIESSTQSRYILRYINIHVSLA